MKTRKYRLSKATIIFYYNESGILQGYRLSAEESSSSKAKKQGVDEG